MIFPLLPYTAILPRHLGGPASVLIEMHRNRHRNRWLCHILAETGFQPEDEGQYGGDCGI
jgi:hypothetical protein